MRTKPVWMLMMMVFGLSGYSMDLKTSEGMPFGQITDQDGEHLFVFSKKCGLDLNAEIEKAYEKKDMRALGHVFRLSKEFKQLDPNARTYGQIIYSSLLRFGETMGVEAYVDVINEQEAEVQQRIRDFLYYPMTLSSPEVMNRELDEVNNRYPTLFPKKFVFAKGDPIFQSKAQLSK